MQKFLICFFSVLIFISAMAINSYASGNNLLNNSGDDSSYIENSDELDKILNMENEAREEIQNEYKIEYMKDLKDLRNGNSKYAKEYKAKVIWASSSIPEYIQNTYTGEYFKTTYQEIRVKIIEGPFADKNISGDILGPSGEDGLIDGYYILNCDQYENMLLPETKAGDIIYVRVYETEEGIRVNSGSYDSPKPRLSSTIFIVIMALVFILIYAGKYGLKAIIPFALLFDLIIIVVAPTICTGFSCLILVSFTILLTSILIPVLKFGVNEKSISVALSTAVVLVIMAVVIIIFNAIVGNIGITFESNYLKDITVPIVINDSINHLINFESLSNAVTILIMLVAVIYVSCKAVEIYEKANAKDKIKYVLEEMKEFLGDSYILVGRNFTCSNIA